MRVFALLRFVLVTIVCLAAAAAGAQEPPPASEVNDPQQYGAADIRYSSIALDLGLVRKMRADEFFIKNGSCGDLDTEELLASNSVEAEQLCKRVVTPDGECRAWKAYCDAYAIVEGTNASDLDPDKQNTRTLLLKDIEYRLLLLDGGVPFWGGARSLTPSIPITHVRVMEGLLRDLEKQVLEVSQFASKIEGDQSDVTRLKAFAEDVRGRFQAEALTEEKSEVIKLEQKQRERQFDDRIVGLEQQRKVLEQEAADLRSEADQLAAGAERAILDGVASSMGVPPGLIDAAQQGDVKAAALSALADPRVAGEVNGIVKNFGDSTKQFVELYEQGSELYAQYKDAEKTIDGAKDFLRKPTADKLIRLGTLVSKRLDNDTVKEIDKVVKEAAPVLSLVDSVRTLKGKAPTEICEALHEQPLLTGKLGLKEKSLCGLLDLSLPKACEKKSRQSLTTHCKQLGMGDAAGGLCLALERGCGIQDTLAQHVNQLDQQFGDLTLEIEDAILDVIDDAGDQYLEVYSDAMRRLAEFQLSDEELRLALSDILRMWSYESIGLIIEATPAPQRVRVVDLLARQLKVSFAASMSDQQKRDALARALSARGLESLPLVQIQNAKLTIREATGGPLIVELAAAKFLQVPDPTKIREEYLGNIKEDVRRSFARLGEKKGALRQSLLRYIRPDSTEELINKGIVKEAAGGDKHVVEKKLWDNLSKQNGRVAELGRDLVVGRTVAVDLRPELNLPAPVAPAPEQAPRGQQGPTVEQALADQAVKRALDAALPGAGVALQVAQSLAALDANIDRQQRIGEDSVRLGLLMIEAQDAADDAHFLSVLAEKDQEIAGALRDAATRQLQIYSFGIKQSVRNANLARSKVKIRRALTFYAAERLREEFDLFNRSMGLWAGIEGQPNNYIVNLIKSNPGQLRLALDPQIHLFGWLNREGEATRTDVDALMIHWRQLLRLAKDVCQIRGCTPGSGRLGQTAQTGQLLLSQLISTSEFQRFRNWQSAPGYDPFRTEILIHPSLPAFPPAYRNLRFVDLRSGWVDSAGDLSVAEGLTIRHPGTAVVAGSALENPERVGFNREVLLSRQTSSFDIPDPYNIDDLRNRWADNNDRDAGIFEGYGLFTILEVTVYPTQASLEASDLALRFAFAYTDPDNVVTEQDFVSQLRVKGIDPRIKINPYAHTFCLSEGKADKRGNLVLGSDGKAIRKEICSRPADFTVPPIVQMMRPGNGSTNRDAAVRVQVELCNLSTRAVTEQVRAQILAETDARFQTGKPSTYDDMLKVNNEVVSEVAEQLRLINAEFHKRRSNGLLSKSCPHYAEIK